MPQRAGQKSKTTEQPATKGGATRDDILEAAANLIVTQGYSACTMRSISEKVKIKAGSLYYHFASKDEIVVEIMNRGTEMLLDEVREALEQLPESAGFEDRLRKAVGVHVACKLDQATPFLQVYEHLTPVIKRQSREKRRVYTQLWMDMIEEGKRNGAVRKDLNTGFFVSYLLTGLNRLPEWFHRETMKIEDVTRMILDMTTNGISGQ